VLAITGKLLSGNAVKCLVEAEPAVIPGRRSTGVAWTVSEGLQRCTMGWRAAVKHDRGARLRSWIGTESTSLLGTDRSLKQAHALPANEGEHPGFNRGRVNGGLNRAG
jgi:hypothetical protein